LFQNLIFKVFIKQTISNLPKKISKFFGEAVLFIGLVTFKRKFVKSHWESLKMCAIYYDRLIACKRLKWNFSLLVGESAPALAELESLLDRAKAR